jgi:hypothetical protein
VKNKFQSRVPWREKMERAQEPKLVQVPPKMSRFGKGMMLIPTPDCPAGSEEQARYRG